MYGSEEVPDPPEVNGLDAIVGVAVGVGVLVAGVLVGVGVAVAVCSVKSVRAGGRIVRVKPIGGWLK